MKRVLFLFGMALFAWLQSNAQTVNVEVAGIRNDNGNIMVMAQSKNVAKGDTCSMKTIYAKAKAAKNSVMIQLNGVKTKDIILSVFHDENNNYQLDMDDQHRPVEGFARGSYHVNPITPTAIKIKLYYPVTE